MASINVNNANYEIIDTREKMTVADSFVKRSNKIMTGNGEAKFYVGNDNTEVRNFFGTAGFEDRCFLLKKDLEQYLKDAEAEYKTPQQPYRHKDEMPHYWQQRVASIALLPPVLWFNLKEQTQITGSRIYVKSDDPAYDLIRELSLPFITYLSAIKLKSNDKSIVYYFRLFVDYFGDAQHPGEIRIEEEKVEAEPIPDEEKKQIQYARIGQGKYRKALLNECPFCPITLVSDDRLLIASHIKPWVASPDHEKTDPKNGFMFTPTYDFLFDRGFITFTDDKRMLVSPWLSKMTCSKLNIADDKKFNLLPVEGRELYLHYHRANVFKA
ncbi:HNH endonuclease [Mucilaginibacter sp.]|uniref:HNH endonuclease n=1 Tax=Mucilaginibacter sp. TaxID=1882438 RepID=UPI00261F26CB|nr:HNH endonuclease [Mucilaginibacter sp.]MDB5029458.1 endonuclease family protein [Mucilaginibacter sp.]